MNKLIYKILHHPILHKQTVVQATILITIISFFSKFIGYAREMLIAYFFGASSSVDAFIIGLQVPTLILGLFAGTMSNLIIPFYLSRKLRDPNDAKRYFNQILQVWGVFFLLVSILTSFFAPQLIHIIAFGFEGEQFDLAVGITRILALFGFFNILNGLFKGLLRAEKQFLAPVVSEVVFNVFNVFVIFTLSSFYGVYALVIGIYVMVIGNVLFFIFLLSNKYKLLCFVRININWQEIKEFLFLLTPLILSSGIASVNTLVDRSVASGLVEGSLSALKYADRVWQLPLSIFAGTLAITIFPSFSEMASDKLRLFEYKRNINKTIVVLLYFMLPSSVFLILYSYPITRLLYQRGAFDAQATSLTSFVNQMYCLGIFFTATYPILMKIFYSFKNTITPLIISLGVVALNILGNILLSRYFQAGGIALATSLSKMIGFFLSYFLLLRYFRSINQDRKNTKENLLLESGKIMVSCIPMTSVGLLLLPWVNISISFALQALKMVLIVLIMGSVFYISSKVMYSKGYNIAQGYLIAGAKKLKIVRS